MRISRRRYCTKSISCLLRHLDAPADPTYKGLDVEEEHPNGVVPGLVQLEEVHSGVLYEEFKSPRLTGTEVGQKMTYHRSSKRAVQPTTTLTDELNGTLGHISLGLAGFHVCKRPFVTGLGGQFEAQDTILRQEHVLGEDIHAVDTLRAQSVCERVVTVEILFQRPSEDCTIAVSGESTGQHGDVAETTFEGLV